MWNQPDAFLFVSLPKELLLMKFIPSALIIIHQAVKIT